MDADGREIPLVEDDQGEAMRTYKRVCIKDYEIIDKNGDYFKIEKGKEYLTSGKENGEVWVFSTYWVTVPISHFRLIKRFT